MIDSIEESMKSIKEDAEVTVTQLSVDGSTKEV